MPRDIGTSIGVKLTRPASVGAARGSARSRGCAGGAADAVALALPITSLPSRCGFAALPAPLVPEAATTTTSGSTSPAASAGARASVETVG